MTPADREKLVEAFGNAMMDCGDWDEENEHTPEPYEHYLAIARAARAALLAAMEPVQGEVYEVWGSADGELHVTVTPQHYEPGDRVRVSRVEDT